MIRRASWLLGLLLASCGGGDTDPIFLGLAGPMEQASGQSMRNAAEMAVEELNADGGIVGRRVELIVRDDHGTGEGAIEAALSLRDDPRTVAVVGHINSGATLAAADIYNDQSAGIVELSPASSAPSVTHAGPWTFRVCPSDLQHGPTLAERAWEDLGARRALVLYANDAYGRGVASSFSGSFDRLGGTVVDRNPFLDDMSTESASRDLDPFLERGLAGGVDALVIGGQAGPALGIIQAARRLGFTGPVLGADGLTGIRSGGAIAEGVYVSSAYLPDRDTPESQRFAAAYRERYGELPDHRAAMTYDAVRLLAVVITEAGVDREAVRDRLARVGQDTPAFDGVSGSIGFDDNGDLQRNEVAVGVVRGGTLVTANGGEN